MDGLSAKLEVTNPTDSSSSIVESSNDMIARLRFDGDTFSGKIIEKDGETEISGFKFGNTNSLDCLVVFIT